MEFGENIAKMQRGTVDRISELPDFILHYILSMLDTKEAGRASVLSKKWYGAWSSIPVLNFQPWYFKYEFEDDTRTLERFVEFIDRTMQRYFMQKYRITNMYLVLPKVDEKLESLADKWIMIAVENQIERLEIQIFGGGNEYRLPEILFCSKSLKYLKCCRVGLPYYATMELISFEYLILVPETVDEDMLQEMISFCPLVELDITYDNHLEEISLPLMRKVNREVEGGGSGTMQSNLQASQLQKFVYRGCCPDFWPWNMNVVALKNLRKLEICWASITDDIVSVLASGLIVLEILVLDTCSMLKCIKISSISLKELQILNNIDYNELKNVRVDAPNLHEFSYKCKVETSLSLIRALDHCNAQFSPLVTSSISNAWFVKLRKFLTETNVFKSVMLNLACTHLVVAEEEQQRNVVIGQPYKLRELKLRESRPWDSSKSSLKTFLDGLLWCCHPDVLSITTSLENSDAQLIVSILKEKARSWKDPLKSIEVECIVSPQLLSYLFELEIRLRLSW